MRRLPAALVASVALWLAACGGGGGSTNALPIARAGADQSVNAGTAVNLSGATSTDSDGSIATYAWTQSGCVPVTLVGANTATPSFVAPTVAGITRFTLTLVVTDNDGATSSPSAVTVTVNPLPGSNVTVAGEVRYARVPFAAPSSLGLNYASPVLQPARGIVVEALDSCSQSVIASGITSSTGRYQFSVPSGSNIAIRAVARLLSDPEQALPRWDVRAQASTDAAVQYSFTGASFDSSAGTHNLEIPTGISAAGVATGTRASGPFAALDTIYSAIHAVLSVASPTTNFPTLAVVWDSTAPGTFFSPSFNQFISLNGDLTEDTDEFDPHVVAHEFGHYLEHNFSRADNIGGSHAVGDRLDPRVAFGEGWGYAFAAMVAGDPMAVDSYVTGAGAQRAARFNVESNPPGDGSGNGCWCSESSVWAILWDLYDSAPDGSDNVSVGLQPIWDVLTSYQRDTYAFTTIFPFIEALKTVQPANATAIDALVAAQNINSAGINAFATAENNAPITNVLPIYATVAVGSPVVVRSTDDAGAGPDGLTYYNRVGNRRYVRFVPVTAGTVTITVASSNPLGPDPDFWVWDRGTVQIFESPPATTEVGTVAVVPGRPYIIDAYECANGCDTPQGTPGDYDLTVSVVMN